MELRLVLPAVIVAAVLSAPAQAQPADPALARNLAASCTGCHGNNGVSQGGLPSLAGQPKAELLRKLQEFRSGARTATLMQQLAKGYTDAQLELIADWFARQPESSR